MTELSREPAKLPIMARLVNRAGWKTLLFGAELASTTVVKALFLLGVTCRDRLFIPANDNVALVAANDNHVVADRIAA